MPEGNNGELRSCVARTSQQVKDLADHQRDGFQALKDESDELDERLRMCEQAQAATNAKIEGCQEKRRAVCPGCGDGKTRLASEIKETARAVVLEYHEKHPTPAAPAPTRGQRAKLYGQMGGAAGIVCGIAKILELVFTHQGGP